MYFFAVAIVMVIGVAVLMLAINSPKSWMGLVVYAIVFGPFLAGFHPLFGLADELVIVVTFLVAVWYRLRDGSAGLQFPGSWFFALFAVVGSAGAVVNNVEFSVWLPGLFLATKSLILGWSALQIPVAYDVRFLSRLFAGLAGLTIVGVIANVAFPAYWFEMFSVGGGSERGGIQSPVGFMVHPGYLAQLTVLLAIAAYVLMAARGLGWERGAALFLVMLFISIMTLRRKALLGLILALAALAFSSYRGRAARVSLILVALFVTLAFFGSQLYAVYQATIVNYLGAGSAAPRTLLYRGAAFLASDYFPLGSGFGRFGTAVANDNYSPEYVRLGFSTVYGLAPGDDYGQDAFWPGVLGETGWLGSGFYLAGILSIAMFFGRRAVGGSVRLKAVMAAVSLGWWVEFAVESVATPVYLAAPLGPLLFVLVAVVHRSSEESVNSMSGGLVNSKHRVRREA